MSHTQTKGTETFADRVRAIPGGEHLEMCYSCGTCVSKCMIQQKLEPEYNPRRLLRMVMMGMEDEAFARLTEHNRGPLPSRTIRAVFRELVSGSRAPLVFRLLNRGDTWAVYDVVIEGLSLVKNYHTSFGPKIEQIGLDGLIDDLAGKNARGDDGNA